MGIAKNPRERGGAWASLRIQGSLLSVGQVWLKDGEKCYPGQQKEGRALNTSPGGGSYLAEAR